MKKILLLVLIVVLVLFAAWKFKGYEAAKSAPAPCMDVGLIQLLQSPGEFDGKRVRLVGFMHQQAGDDALYLHQEDTAQGSALWVDAPADATGLDGKLVVCEGTFNAGKHGHPGTYGGELENVTRAQVVP